MQALSKKQRPIKFISIIFLNLFLIYIVSVLCLFTTEASSFALENLQSDHYLLAPCDISLQDRRHVIENDLRRHHFTAQAQCRRIFHSQHNHDLLRSLKHCFRDINRAILLKKSSIKEPITGKLTIVAREGGKSSAWEYTIKGTTSEPNGYIFGALSTFVPVLVLLVAIIAARLARFILDFSKLTATFLLDRYTESAIDKDKKKFVPEKFIPGTLTGVLIGILTASLSLLKELIQYWHQRL